MGEFGQVGLPSRSSCYTTPAIQLFAIQLLAIQQQELLLYNSPGEEASPCSPAVSDLPPVFTKANCLLLAKQVLVFRRLSPKNTKSLGCHQGIETLLWPGLAGEKGGSLQRHSNSGPLCYPRQLKGAVLPKTCRASQFRMGTLLLRSGSQGHVAYFQLPSRKHPVFSH